MKLVFSIFVVMRYTYVTHNDRNWSGRGSIYPDDLYSPVEVMFDSEHTVGVSVLYPVLEYEHSVRLQPISPGGIYTYGGRNWEIVIHLDGDLPAGAEREYVLAVRVLPKSMPWQYTLLPYREYFQNLYGGVRYTRDPRPIVGMSVSQVSSISPTNARGYVGSRIDTQGWGAWVDAMRLARSNGFERTMVWGVSGHYDAAHARQYNYPPQLVSPLRDMPAAHGSRHLLQQLANEGWRSGCGGPFAVDC